MTWKRKWTPHVVFFLGPDQRLGGWVDNFLYQRDKLWVQTAFCISMSQQCCKEMIAKELSLWACCPPYSRAERASQGSESPILGSSLPSTPPFPLWCVPSLQLLMPSHLPLAHFIQEPFPKPPLQADFSVTAGAWGGGFFIILSPTPAATGARQLHPSPSSKVSQCSEEAHRVGADPMLYGLYSPSSHPNPWQCCPCPPQSNSHSLWPWSPLISSCPQDINCEKNYIHM